MKRQTLRLRHSPSAFSELIPPKWTNAPNCYAERTSDRLHVAVAKKDVCCGEGGVRPSRTVFVFIVQNNMTCSGTVFVCIAQNNVICVPRQCLFISYKTTWHVLGQCLFISPKTTWHLLGQCLFISFKKHYIHWDSIYIIQNNVTYTGTVVVCFTQRPEILFSDYVFPNQHSVCPVLYYTAAGIDRSLLNIYSILFLCKEVCCTRLTTVRTGEKIATPTPLHVSVTSKTGQSLCLWQFSKQKQTQSIHQIFLYKEWNSLGQIYQVLDERNTVTIVTLQQAGGSVWLYPNQHGTVESRGCLLGNVILGSSQKCRVSAI
jgi:hypothetical protein